MTSALDLITVPMDANDDGITLTGDDDTMPWALRVGAPSIEKLRKRFDEARQDPSGARKKSETDRDYYDGPKQLDSETRRILGLRKQPPIYTNRVRPAVNGVLGVLEAGRMDPRAYSRNPDDEQAADVCTKALRFIADQSRFNDTKQDVAENYLIEGTGACIVEMDGEKIVPTQIRWEEFYYDPYSRRPDFKDARYMGIAKWKDAEEIRATYGARISEIGDPLAPGGTMLSSYEDRPGAVTPWVDLKRRRCMLIEEYAIENGVWMRILYIAAGVLEYAESPWLDEKNEPCNPIEAASCYVDRENTRYGMVRDMIPIQDEVNASRSRSLHLMNSRQVQERELGSGAGTDAKTVRDEAAKADGIIPTGWVAISNSEQTSANLSRMQESKYEIERMGPTPAVLGRQEGGNQSGRARLVSQQAGLTELARPLGRLSAWSLRVYTQCWWRAQQFWTAPKWIRITDDANAAKFLQINEPQFDDAGQPVLEIDPRTGQPMMQPVVGPDGQPVVDPQTGQPAMQPVQKVANRLAALDVDILIEATPDTANLAQEVWADLLDLSKSVPIGTPQWMIALELSPIPDKGRVLDKIKAWQQSQQQQPDPAAEQMKATALAKEAAEIEKIEAETEKSKAQVSQIMFNIGRAGAGVVDHDPAALERGN